MSAFLNYLETKSQNDQQAFKVFLTETSKAIALFNLENNTDLSLWVDFKKDKWLGSGTVDVIISLGDREEKYSHSAYSDLTDLNSKSFAYALMASGILSNTWFSVLDKTRSYDTSFVIDGTINNWTFDDESPEFQEKRYNDTRYRLLLPKNQQAAAKTPSKTKTR